MRRQRTRDCVQAKVRVCHSQYRLVSLIKNYVVEIVQPEMVIKVESHTDQELEALESVKVEVKPETEPIEGSETVPFNHQINLIQVFETAVD